MLAHRAPDSRAPDGRVPDSRGFLRNWFGSGTSDLLCNSPDLPNTAFSFFVCSEQQRDNANIRATPSDATVTATAHGTTAAWVASVTVHVLAPRRAGTARAGRLSDVPAHCTHPRDLSVYLTALKN